MSVQKFAKNIITAIFVHQMKCIIKKHNPKIVAVVGSVGKTITKHAVATVLGQKYRVMAQEGNYNAPISVPFIFLGRSLPSLHNPFGWLMAWFVGQKIVWGKFPYDIVVVELGTDKPGDISDFKNMLHPDITVVTAVSDEHMEFFGTLEAVAKEELAISQFSRLMVINTDDIDPDYINKYVSPEVESYTLGYNNSPDYALSAQLEGAGFDLTVTKKGDFKVSASVKLTARHSLKAVAAAVVVANILELNRGQIEQGMAEIVPPPGRMQILKGIKNSTIIDDTYNASPLAYIAALQTLYEKTATQKILLFGNMNELGETSQASHEEIAKLCDYKQLSLIVTLGQDANKYVPPIAEALGCNVKTSNSPYEAASIIADNLKDGGLILCKGSQNGVFAEETVKMLLADPIDADKLVRQTDFWLAKKHKQFDKLEY